MSGAIEQIGETIGRIKVFSGTDEWELPRDIESRKRIILVQV